MPREFLFGLVNYKSWNANEGVVALVENGVLNLLCVNGLSRRRDSSGRQGPVNKEGGDIIRVAGLEGLFLIATPSRAFDRLMCWMITT